jgi:hypothetical protein
MDGVLWIMMVSAVLDQPQAVTLLTGQIKQHP